MRRFLTFIGDVVIGAVVGYIVVMPVDWFLIPNKSVAGGLYVAAMIVGAVVKRQRRTHFIRRAAPKQA